MLKRLTIHDFFDVPGNTRDIPFDSELIVFAGKNGSGKTTILNFLSAIIQKRFAALLKIPFSQASVEFDTFALDVIKLNGRVLVKYKDCARRIIRDLEQEGHQVSDFERALILEYDKNEPIQRPRELDEIELFEDILERYRVIVRGQLPGARSDDFDDFFLPENALYFPTYRRFETDLANIVASATGTAGRSLARRLQSLQEDLSSEVAPGVVVGYSNQDIGQIVGHQWSIATEFEKSRLNRLVRSFTISLVDQRHVTKDPEESDLNSLQHILLQGLAKAHILEQGDEAVIRDYTERVRQGLEVRRTAYANGEGASIDDVYDVLMFPIIRKLGALWEQARNDIDTQWEPFERLKATLGLFLDKQAVIKDDGSLVFVIGSHEIGFESLSAGEKQLVAFFVYVGLNTQPGSIVLIDEPELSLHVLWQRELLPALLKIAPGRQFITSTHSPFIAGKFHNAIHQVGEVGE